MHTYISICVYYLYTYAYPCPLRPPVPRPRGIPPRYLFVTTRRMVTQLWLGCLPDSRATVRIALEKSCIYIIYIYIEREGDVYIIHASIFGDRALRVRCVPSSASSISIYPPLGLLRRNLRLTPWAL